MNSLLDRYQYMRELPDINSFVTTVTTTNLGLYYSIPAPEAAPTDHDRRMARLVAASKITLAEARDLTESLKQSLGAQDRAARRRRGLRARLHTTALELLLSDYIAIYGGTINMRVLHMEARRFARARREGATPLLSVRGAQILCRRTRIDAGDIIDYMDALFAYVQSFSVSEVPMFVLALAEDDTEDAECCAPPLLVPNRHSHMFQRNDDYGAENAAAAAAAAAASQSSVSVTEVEVDGDEGDLDDAAAAGTITFDSHSTAMPATTARKPPTHDVPPRYQAPVRYQPEMLGYTVVEHDDSDSDDSDDDDDYPPESLVVFDGQDVAAQAQNSAPAAQQDLVAQPSNTYGHVYYYNALATPTADNVDDEFSSLQRFPSHAPGRVESAAPAAAGKEGVETLEETHNPSDSPDTAPADINNDIDSDDSDDDDDDDETSTVEPDAMPPLYSEPALDPAVMAAATAYPFTRRYIFSPTARAAPDARGRAFKSAVIETVTEISSQEPARNDDGGGTALGVPTAPVLPQDASADDNGEPTSFWRRVFKRR